MEDLAYRVKRETCSMCPGHRSSWVGSSTIGCVTICGLCRDYLREQLALLEWTTPGVRAAESE